MHSSIDIYFVRHGQRIDHVDPTWSSPFPQDPPLTDRGRLQATWTGRTIHSLTQETMASASMASKSSASSFASMTSSSSLSASSFASTSTTTATADINSRHISNARPTPPRTPEREQGPGPDSSAGSAPLLPTPRQIPKHHYAIVTSPFLRCTQTAVDLAKGLHHANKEDVSVTIATEPGLSEWFSFDYVPVPVPETILVERMKDFAMTRRDHEQFYSVDWKYRSRQANLPEWPEAFPEMQHRCQATFNHILTYYTQQLHHRQTTSPDNKDASLSLILVSHASPVNGLLEACLGRPMLTKIQNCAISRCRWKDETMLDSDDDDGYGQEATQLGQSHGGNGSGTRGRWHLDLLGSTVHLDRNMPA